MTVLSLADIRLAQVAAQVVARASHQQAADFATLAERLGAFLSSRAPGPCVFTMSIPLEATIQPAPTKRGKARKPVKLLLAPRLNEYAAMPPWTLKLARAEIDRRILEARAAWPCWDCGSARVVTNQRVKHGKRSSMVDKLSVTGGRPRIIEVVRRSSREVDEVAIDILGGKLVVDRLIWAGVIAGDTRKLLVRMPRWERAKPGQGRLDVAVYELPSGA